MEVVASLSQGRTAAAQCGLFTYKSVPVIFEPPCIFTERLCSIELASIFPKNLLSLQIEYTNFISRDHSIERWE